MTQFCQARNQPRPFAVEIRIRDTERSRTRHDGHTRGIQSMTWRGSYSQQKLTNCMHPYAPFAQEGGDIVVPEAGAGTQ